MHMAVADDTDAPDNPAAHLRQITIFSCFALHTRSGLFYALVHQGGKGNFMKDWNNLIADENQILSRHYNAGRQGHRIRYVVIHHNAGNLSIGGCYSVWQSRQASAHYQVDANGRIGQLVHDRDTAWHAGNWTANLDSIGIEHADISSSPWMVSDATLDNGAHLVAAICKCYGLGYPQWGVNVFPHQHFSATACPASLYGAQRDAYMARAQAWYTQMGGGSAPSPISHKSVPISGKLAVDGYCGAATIRKWQSVMHTQVDGIISGQVVPDNRIYGRPNLVTAQVRYGNTGSNLIRAVQRQLGITADGFLGPNTIRAIQKHLGVGTDGWFGPATVKALQNQLNRNRF